MLKKIAVLIFISIFLSSCGPIIGQLMKVSEGIKDFRIIAGSLNDLGEAQNILVITPFAKESEDYNITRGDDAGMFFRELNNKYNLNAELHVVSRNSELAIEVSAIRSKSSGQLKDELGLETEPDLVLFGTILDRKTMIAPARGIIMRVAYRLELFNPVTNGSTVIEVSVKNHLRDCVKLVVTEILRRAEIGDGK